MGQVRRKTNGDLTLWCYTEQAQYKKEWNDVTIVARGLITDSHGIVALPFPKFFNLSEHGPDWQCPDGVPSIFDKVDGSLGILFNYKGQWRCATKGSFDSEQAKWFQAIVDKMDHQYLNTEITYLVELVYPANRIVVDYGRVSALYPLGGYNRNTGQEIDPQLIYTDIANATVPLDICVRDVFTAITSMGDCLEEIKERKNAEGYVIRWPCGTRVKVKTEEYILLHKAISNLSPLSVWEALRDGKLPEMRESLPEELWPTFDEYAGALNAELWHIAADVLELHSNTFEMTPKELGLALKAGNTFNLRDSSNASFIWDYRKYPNKPLEPPWPNPKVKGWDAIMRKIRPTGNRME